MEQLKLRAFNTFKNLKSLLEEADGEREDPILIHHNEDVVFLQYTGWSINLYKDGTWAIECTEGG